jgi:hypothetical protein
VGASLVSAKHDLGAVEVVEDGTTIAAVPAPSAQDAEGVAVPVSMSVSGDVLTVSVDQRAGVYRYPIEVDPTVVEEGGYEHEPLWEEWEGKQTGGTWGFYTEHTSVFKVEKVGSEEPFYLEDEIGGASGAAAGERAFFYYRTQGESRIYEVTASTSFAGAPYDKMENVLGIENVHTGKPEVSQSWIESYGADPTLCTESGCASGTVSSSNDKSEVFYEQDARENEESGKSELKAATVDIVQTAGPSASFIPIEKWVRSNYEHVILSLNATDPGLGIQTVEVTSPNAPGWNALGGEGWRSGCTGVQCEECYSTNCGQSPLTWNDLYGLPDGEDVIEGTVKDPVGWSATAKTTVKIDNTPPHSLTLTGLPAGNEIGYGYYRLKLSATDGSGSTPSSGVASIALAIDGKEIG